MTKIKTEIINDNHIDKSDIDIKKKQLTSDNDDDSEVLNSTISKKNNDNNEIILANDSCDSVTIIKLNNNSDKPNAKGATHNVNVELKPILTNGNGSLNRNGTLTSSGGTTPSLETNNSTLRKKSVTFDNKIDPPPEVEKFIDGDVIVDQQNPFKHLTASESLKLKFFEVPDKSGSGERRRIIKIQAPPVRHEGDGEDSEFISTEDVLRQSKYVKTYIKNPDPILTYDYSVIEQIRSEDEADIAVIKPNTLPKPRRLVEKPQPKARHKIEAKKVEIPHYRVKSPNGIKYPELSDLKIKTGTDQEKSLYNPIEVALNARKFDDRFKQAHLGSQDDLDEIAEQTDVEVSALSVDETDRAEPNPSFTNTVTSEEFREFLNRKGLTLTPAKLPAFAVRNGNGNIPRKIEEEDSIDMDGNKGIKKRTMLGRLLSGGIFSKSSKTTPKEEQKPQLLYQSRAPVSPTAKTQPIKRVVLERQSYHGAGHQHHTPIIPDETSSISSQLTAADDYVDDRNMRMNKSLRRSVRVENNPELVKPRLEYDRSPTEAAPTIRRVERVTSPVVSRTVTEYPVYRTIDPTRVRSMSSRLKPPSGRTSAPITTHTDRIEYQQQHQQLRPQEQQQPRRVANGSVVRATEKPINYDQITPDSLTVEQQQRPVKKVKPPVPIRRTPERQSLNSPRKPALNTEAAHDESLYGNINRASSLNRNHRYYQSLQGVPAQVKISRSPVIYNAANQKIDTFTTPLNSSEELLDGPKSTSTPIEEKSKLKQPAMKAEDWAKLRELKLKNDQMIYGVNIIRPETFYNKPESHQKENIYESTEKLRSQPQVPPMPGHLVRNSPQRSTIDGSYRTRLPSLQQQQQQQHQQMILIEQQQQQQQQNVFTAPKKQNIPMRSQSVLDNMTGPRSLEQQQYGVVNQRSSSVTPVVLRRPGVVKNNSMSKEDILYRVREFCRRSINKTPTGLETREFSPAPTHAKNQPQNYATIQRQQPEISYLIQSPQMHASPTYVSAMKRSSVHSTNSEYAQARRHHLPSDTDSVFMHDDTTPQPSPRRIMTLPQDARAEVYGRIQHPTPQYGFIHENTLYSVPKQQRVPEVIYSPVTTSGRPRNAIRYVSDGRATPLVLYSLPNTNQKLAVPVSQIHVPRNTLPKSTGDYRTYYQHPAAVSPRYESESGSEAGEVQRIMQNRRGDVIEEDWQNDKTGRTQQNEQAPDDRRRAARSREDPRRHTLGGDMLHYGGQAPPQRTMDLEMGTRSQKSKKTPPIRGYAPVNQGPLFDDDPGIMSEVETASTGFRRGGKQRSSLPVVRTPSKTLERPLGLVFLQYRSETKRALLPNEITSIDTVRALFVRSFPRQLTMAYLEGPNVKIYIHDASKDMFYELEDVRSHLREIRDRSVLRLFESNEVVAPQVLPGGPGVPQPLPPSGATGHWDQDQSYFSEPEFDSEYQHQHIHKSSKGGKGAPYYVGAAQTLPRGHMYTDRNKNAIGAPAKPLRSYGSSMGPPFPYPDQLYSIPDGYMSSPERGTRGGYEEPYYSQYGTRGGAVTPIIDEEQSESSLAEDQYSLYGVKVSGRIPRGAGPMYDPTRPEDLHRMRIEHMERQLANLTGVVQKALTQNPIVGGQVAVNPNYLAIPGQMRNVPDDMDGHSSSSSTSIQANGTEDLYIREKPPKLGKSSCHKSVSFEKSVSFSDDIQGAPKSHTPQHPADSKPPKPAIKSSTLPRTSSQERDRLKPPPPPKPLGLAPTTHQNYRADLAIAPEVYNHLRGLQKKAKDLRTEVRTLRRLSQAQAVAVREDIKDAFMRIRATLLSSSGCYWGQGDQETITRLSREEELYKQEAIRLEKDLGDLENSVENLRTEVINRRTRVNMSSVEDMALVLSRASKTVAELKMKYPGLESGLRSILNNEMEKIITEEKFMKDEPMRLESALRRCKKLTGTLVTLKRLASVQEQRLPSASDAPPSEDPPRSADVPSTNKPVPSPRMGSVSVSGGSVAPENALDALLDELQTFAKPSSGILERPDDSTSDDSSQTLQNSSTVTIQLSQSSLYDSQVNQQPNASTTSHHGQTHGLRRLHSYPSGSDTDTSPPQPPRPTSGKPPVPERNADLLSKVNSNKRIPPPPPPRTSSRSPLASPTSPNMPMRIVASNDNNSIILASHDQNLDGNHSSSSESVNSQDHMQRQIALELRHQELLKKQKQLQEQYARLQQISKNNVALQSTDMMHLKKTGSESNLPQKMGLNMSVSGSSGSMKNLLNSAEINCNNFDNQNNEINSDSSSTTTTGSATGAATTQQQHSTTNKVYETDIL